MLPVFSVIFKFKNKIRDKSHFSVSNFDQQFFPIAFYHFRIKFKKIKYWHSKITILFLYITYYYYYYIKILSLDFSVCDRCYLPNCTISFFNSKLKLFCYWFFIIFIRENMYFIWVKIYRLILESKESQIRKFEVVFMTGVYDLGNKTQYRLINIKIITILAVTY